jgi:ribosomal protein S18 acetylase RimI-like enzyme
VSQRPAGAGESGPPVPRLAVCPALDDTALNALFAASWPAHEPTAFGPRHARSLLWVAAFRDARSDGLTEPHGLTEPDSLAEYGGLEPDGTRESDSLRELAEQDGSGELVGYVNVVGDGGVHAFLLDTTVHPSARRQGLGVRLAHRAADEARRAGAHWLHVDHESHLTGFHARCGFAPTAAGLRRLV